MAEQDGIERLLQQNRRWAAEMCEREPDFFTQLAGGQQPRWLWIGCADSRVPANEIVGLRPGEIFVHRNVANVVVHSDLNCLSVLQFAVEVLKVRHVIVCGHYGCGGVSCAYRGDRAGLVDNWLCHVRDVHQRWQARFPEGLAEHERIDLLCALNVIEQVRNVCRTTVVADAWARGQALSVHGLVYGLSDGILHDLGARVDGEAGLAEADAAAERLVAQGLPA